MSALSSTLPGTWSLVSRIDITTDGAHHHEPTLGNDPIALLNYDRAGNFSAQFMKRHRTVDTIEPSHTDGGPNNTQARGGYDAYFGSYQVDDANGTVTQTLLGALSPGNVGQTVTRSMRVDGDQLVIVLDTISAGVPVTRTLTWRRVG